MFRDVVKFGSIRKNVRRSEISAHKNRLDRTEDETIEHGISTIERVDFTVI